MPVTRSGLKTTEKSRFAVTVKGKILNDVNDENVPPSKIPTATKKKKPLNKARPVPDFKRLHKSWNNKFESGKACIKKPLTQCEEFDLTKSSQKFKQVRSRTENESPVITQPDFGDDDLEVAADQLTLAQAVAGSGSCSAAKRPVLGELPTTVSRGGVDQKDRRSEFQSLAEQQQLDGLAFEKDSDALQSILENTGVSETFPTTTAPPNYRQTIAGGGQGTFRTPSVTPAVTRSNRGVRQSIYYTGPSDKPRSTLSSIPDNTIKRWTMCPSSNKTPKATRGEGAKQAVPEPSSVNTFGGIYRVPQRHSIYAKYERRPTVSGMKSPRATPMKSMEPPNEASKTPFGQAQRVMRAVKNTPAKSPALRTPKQTASVGKALRWKDVLQTNEPFHHQEKLPHITDELATKLFSSPQQDNANRLSNDLDVKVSSSNQLSFERDADINPNSHHKSGRHIDVSSAHHLNSGRDIDVSSAHHHSSGRDIDVSSAHHHSSGRDINVSSAHHLNSGRDIVVSSAHQLSHDSYFEVSSPYRQQIHSHFEPLPTEPETAQQIKEMEEIEKLLELEIQEMEKKAQCEKPLLTPALSVTMETPSSIGPPSITTETPSSSRPRVQQSPQQLARALMLNQSRSPPKVVPPVVVRPGSHTPHLAASTADVNIQYKESAVSYKPSTTQAMSVNIQQYQVYRNVHAVEQQVSGISSSVLVSPLTMVSAALSPTTSVEYAQRPLAIGQANPGIMDENQVHVPYSCCSPTCYSASRIPDVGGVNEFPLRDSVREQEHANEDRNRFSDPGFSHSSMSELNQSICDTQQQFNDLQLEASRLQVEGQQHNEVSSQLKEIQQQQLHLAKMLISLQKQMAEQQMQLLRHGIGQHDSQLKDMTQKGGMAKDSAQGHALSAVQDRFDVISDQIAAHAPGMIHNTDRGTGNVAGESFEKDKKVGFLQSHVHAVSEPAALTHVSPALQSYQLSSHLDSSAAQLGHTISPVTVPVFSSSHLETPLAATDGRIRRPSCEKALPRHAKPKPYKVPPLQIKSSATADVSPPIMTQMALDSASSSEGQNPFWATSAEPLEVPECNNGHLSPRKIGENAIGYSSSDGKQIVYHLHNRLPENNLCNNNGMPPAVGPPVSHSSVNMDGSSPRISYNRRHIHPPLSHALARPVGHFHLIDHLKEESLGSSPDPVSVTSVTNQSTSKRYLDFSDIEETQVKSLATDGQPESEPIGSDRGFVSEVDSAVSQTLQKQVVVSSPSATVAVQPNPDTHSVVTSNVSCSPLIAPESIINSSISVFIEEYNIGTRSNPSTLYSLQSSKVTDGSGSSRNSATKLIKSKSEKDSCSAWADVESVGSLDENVSKKSRSTPLGVVLAKSKFAAEMKMATKQRFYDVLLDQECALYAHRVVTRFTPQPVVGRFFTNPVVTTLTEGDDKHFMPVREDEPETQQPEDGSAFSRYGAR